MMNFADARHTMVETQLRTTDVTNRELLAVMADVAREDFVPEDARDFAYLDRPVAMKRGRFLSSPSPFARLVQLGDPRPDDRVLLVGAGSGYGAAVLGRLAGSVVALESDGELAAAARRNLSGLANVTVVEGPLAGGAAARAPFSLIVVEGAVPDAPESLFDQLDERGRLVVVEGSGPSAVARIHVREGAVVSARRAFNASMPPLAEFVRAPAFAF